MAKQDIIDQISLETGIMKQTIREVLDALPSSAINHLNSGFPFVLQNVVTLKPVVRGERNARNPQTGEMIRVPAKRVIKAKAAPLLAKAVNP